MLHISPCTADKDSSLPHVALVTEIISFPYPRIPSTFLCFYQPHDPVPCSKDAECCTGIWLQSAKDRPRFFHLPNVCRGKKLLSLSQHLQELALRESGFELALAGTLTTLILANFPTAVFLLLSHCVGRLVRSGGSLTHPYTSNMNRHRHIAESSGCLWIESVVF